jgi:hypothetical protein
MKPLPDPHYRHRFPPAVISQAVWLYHVFSLRLGDVELLLAERGIVVSHGALNSARLSPIACAVVGHGRETSGTWTQFCALTDRLSVDVVVFALLDKRLGILRWD